jgi:hypothetical protein
MGSKEKIDKSTALRQRQNRAVDRLVAAWWRRHFSGGERDAVEAALGSLVIADLDMQSAKRNR